MDEIYCRRMMPCYVSFRVAITTRGKKMIKNSYTILFQS